MNILGHYVSLLLCNFDGPSVKVPIFDQYLIVHVGGKSVLILGWSIPRNELNVIDRAIGHGLNLVVTCWRSVEVIRV